MRWEYRAVLCFANPPALSAIGNARSEELPRASTYQSFLKLLPVVNAIHREGPREAQVVIIIHGGDAQAVLLLCGGALDELEQEKVACAWSGPESNRMYRTVPVTTSPRAQAMRLSMPASQTDGWSGRKTMERGFSISALCVVAPNHPC